jgi:hypothetical protein
MTKDTEQVLGDLLNAVGLLIDGTLVACERLDPGVDYGRAIDKTISEARETNLLHSTS